MESVTLIDSELTAQTQPGCPSFSELYSNVHDELYRYCLYFLGNKEDALDAVQETAIAAFKGFDSVRDISSFKAWILKIAYRKCTQHIGYISFRRKMLCMEHLNIESGDHSMDDIDSALTLANALQELTISERRLILLSLVNGYKSSEIAVMLGKSDGSVRTALSRAVKKLRKALERECI